MKYTQENELTIWAVMLLGPPILVGAVIGIMILLTGSGC